MAGTPKSASELEAEIAINLASAQVPPITAIQLRQVMLDMVASELGPTAGVSSSPNKVLAGPATGTTSAAPVFRSLVAADIPSVSIPLPDYVNIKTYGAVGDGITDDSAALTAFINALQATPGFPLAGFVPAGRYLIKTQPPLITQPIAIYGAGPTKTWFVLDVTFAGDVFRASNTWIQGGLSGNTADFNPASATFLKWGLILDGFSITGNLAATGKQNGIVLYDINDNVRLNYIEIDTLPGSALRVGDFLQNVSPSTQANVSCLRESHLTNLRFWHCGGGTGYPVVRFSGSNKPSAESSNEVNIIGLDIYAANGIAVHFINPPLATFGQSLFRVQQLRIEATASNSPYDSLVFDAANCLGFFNFDFQQLTLLNTNNGQWSIRITGSGADPFLNGWMHLAGQIWCAQGTGKGIFVDSGRFISFDFPRIGVANPADSFKVGPSKSADGLRTQIVKPIALNGYGREQAFLPDLDPSVEYFVGRPALIYGNFLDNANIYSGDGSPNSVGAIATLGTVTPGTLYTDGTYNGTALTGGHGTGATANITVVGGVVTACTLAAVGLLYVTGDLLGATSLPVGSGFSVPVASTTGGEGVIANPGSIFLKTSGSTDLTFWVKETGGGTAGWRLMAMYPRVSNNLISTGTDQATALTLVSEVNHFVSAPNTNTGAVLPADKIGNRLPWQTTIINKSVQLGSFKLYPPVGGRINDGVIDTPIVVAYNTSATMVATSSTRWYTTAVQSVA